MMNKIFKILPAEAWDIITSPYKTNWKGVIFHHTAYSNDEDQGDFVEDLHGGGKRTGYPAFKHGMGYHFLINRSGSIQIGKRWPSQLQGAHCIGKNKTYIGACLAGNFMYDEPTEDQIDSTVKLLFYLGEKATYIHSRFSDTLCPGKNFPFMRINEMYLNLRMENKIRSIDIKRRPIYCKSLTVPKEDV